MHEHRCLGAGQQPLAGGHSYTLNLVSHDDNYPTDPTYVQYDDVTLT